jgi:CRP-like cAMP-binding protein
LWTWEKHSVLPSAETIARAEATLRAGAWLGAAPEDFGRALLALCEWRDIAPGQALSHGGDADGGLYGVGQGWIALRATFGPADVPAIHFQAAPQWVGYVQLVTGEPRIMAVAAKTPVVAAYLPRQGFQQLLSAFPEGWRHVAALSNQILGIAIPAIADLAMADSRRRCAAVLLRAASARYSGDGPCALPLVQEDLAGMAGLTRKTAGQILRDLAAEGLIAVGYRRIVLLRLSALRSLVDGG